MGKISQAYIKLEERAAELGFESLSQAQEAGCEVEWHKDSAELVEPLTAAHRAWEKEKAEVLEGLDKVARYFEVMGYPEDYIPTQHGKTIRNAIKFIEEAHE